MRLTGENGELLESNLHSPLNPDSSKPETADIHHLFHSNKHHGHRRSHSRDHDCHDVRRHLPRLASWQPRSVTWPCWARWAASACGTASPRSSEALQWTH